MLIMFVSNHNPIAGSSYMHLLKELKNSKKGLVNPKHWDNQCSYWRCIIYLIPAEKDPQGIN